MAADAANEDGEPYAWVRCECGAGLWRRYADRLEMVMRPRGHDKRTVSVPLAEAGSVRVKCERCGVVSVYSDSAGPGSGE